MLTATKSSHSVQSAAVNITDNRNLINAFLNENTFLMQTTLNCGLVTEEYIDAE